MDEYALVDNVFCTAILQILESSDYLTGIPSEQTFYHSDFRSNLKFIFFLRLQRANEIDSPTFDWDEVRSDFEQNGTGDETFNGTTNCASKRKPLANLQTKVNRRIPKKALKKQQNNVSRIHKSPFYKKTKLTPFPYYVHI